MEQIVCQSCGAIAVPQSDEILNGRDDVFACPNGCTDWIEEGDITEFSLPLAKEEESE